MGDAVARGEPDDAAAATPARRLEPAAPGAKVTRLELFYDLVFAFAFLNVTTTSARDLGPLDVVAGFLVLSLLWFAWTSFALLGNVIRTDQGIMPLLGFAIMAVIFVAAMSLPEAFTDQRPGPPGDLLFATCFLLARGLQLAIYWYALRDDPASRREWWKLGLPPLVTTSALLTAALGPQRWFTGNAETAARFGLWALAIAFAYTTAAVARPDIRRTISPGHWADRHAQIILVALGESILALGIGPNLQAGLPITWPVIGAAVLGIALVAALWWAYFDVRDVAAEQVLRDTRGRARARLARDAYTYLHLPMIYGIILLSVGLKQVLATIAAPPTGRHDEMLGDAERYALYGGTILYALAVLAFQVRTVRRLSWFSVVVVLVLGALVPLADRLPALAALALLTTAIVAAATLQSLRTRQRRQRLRRLRLRD